MSDEPQPTEISHGEVKLFHLSNPTPSVAYLHIEAKDGRAFNLYFNKSNMKYLNHQSGKIIEQME